MGFVLVVLAAVGVGAGVYWLSMRTEGRNAGGSRAIPIQPPEDGSGNPGTRYVPVDGDPTSWHSRLGGLMGLAIAIAIAALALAAIAYQGGLMFTRLFSGG
jgi:hypothetical protein